MKLRLLCSWRERERENQILHDEFEKLKKTKLTSGMFQIFSFVFQRKGCHRYVIF